MPNYGLVINSRFRPFSYQEMLAPVAQATQSHQALEDAYSELNTNASIWEGLANKESDPITYQRYKDFADALKTQADELAANGLTPTSRQAMSNLRARYASDIIPIKNAYDRRQADIKTQHEVMIKDPTHFFNRRANEVSLDEYLTNDKLDVLSDQYSGALLTQQVGQAAQTLKNTLTNKGALTKLGLPYQYERMLQYGASAEDVMRAMSRDPKAAPILTKLVDDVMASSGIRNWSSMNGDWENNEMYRRAEAYAMQGLYNAIGTTKMEHFTDSYNMQNALAQQEFNRKLELEREKARVKAEQDKKERAASLGTRQRYDITQDDRIKKYKRLGILQEDANGHLSVDRAAFEKFSKMSPAEMKQYSEDLSAQIKVIDDMTKHPAKGGQRNPNYFQYITYDDARRMFPELGFPSGNKGLNVNDQAKLKKHLDNTRASLIETRDAFNSGTGVAQLYSDFGDLGGLSAGDVRTNIDLFERALNANIGDRYTMNQNLYYTVDESQSKAFLNSAKNKQGSLAGLPQYYLDERGNFRKPSSISTQDLDASEIHNVIVRKGKDGKTHAYYELTTKSGEDVALQLPDDLATSLIRYSDDLDAAKHDYLVYQQTLEQDKIDLPYRMRMEHNGQLTLPDRSDIAVTVDDLDNILDNFALAAADLAKTNKTKPVEMQP